MPSDRLFRFGGFAAAAILIAFGVGSLVAGLSGRSEVRDTISRENIGGTPDMTPDLTSKAITSFFAERVALFSIVMGIALLLTGIGFLVLVFGLVRRGAATAGNGRAGVAP